jgi:hypothetical protein
LVLHSSEEAIWEKAILGDTPMPPCSSNPKEYRPYWPV